MTTTKQKETKMKKAVVVTTKHRGVFFGYVEGDTSKRTLELKGARNCLYWPAETHGFLGLASKGPPKDARVGPAVNLKLHDITCVVECSKEATVQWEAEPWS